MNIINYKNKYRKYKYKYNNIKQYGGTISIFDSDELLKSIKIKEDDIGRIINQDTNDVNTLYFFFQQLNSANNKQLQGLAKFLADEFTMDENIIRRTNFEELNQINNETLLSFLSYLKTFNISNLFLMIDNQELELKTYEIFYNKNKLLSYILDNKKETKNSNPLPSIKYESKEILVSDELFTEYDEEDDLKDYNDQNYYLILLFLIFSKYLIFFPGDINISQHKESNKYLFNIFGQNFPGKVDETKFTLLRKIIFIFQLYSKYNNNNKEIDDNLKKSFNKVFAIDDNLTINNAEIETHNDREEWTRKGFDKCIKYLESIDNIAKKSIKFYFPINYGCGMAGGKQENYFPLILNFLKKLKSKYTNAEIVLYYKNNETYFNKGLNNFPDLFELYKEYSKIKTQATTKTVLRDIYSKAYSKGNAQDTAKTFLQGIYNQKNSRNYYF
jgi:hypothetical protein